MSDSTRKTGDFTLPGEAGYEDLTLSLAEQWGADAIRDCDGTQLSDKIIRADFDIYSTICLVRADNEWAKANRDKLQQNYLMSTPVIAESDVVKIDLLSGLFREQFAVNSNDDPKTWWQVFDRTTNEEVPKNQWSFNAGDGTVTIQGVTAWHKYTVNFLATRIWEAISMYNHTTNHWTTEHQMPVDPIYPETQTFMLDYLRQWLADRPRTKIVRFTSLFYNFAWFWGEDQKNHRFLCADWGSYEMTVSPRAMELFEKAKGYKMTSEDFVNNGAYCSSHNVPSNRLLDWMDFMNEFVVGFGRKCIDEVHAAGKVAYMFYDDHWVGNEPYGERFKDFTFDGLIKCVFNAFEARLCAGAQGVPLKELRLHPYLFPTGLQGEPTFMEGGHPGLDAKRFWANIRRGLMRAPVDRIGLGGYLHLVEDYPDFVAAIDEIIDEFRTVKAFHANGGPTTAPLKVAVLTAWGKLRSWVYMGHFIHGMELYEVTESLAGLPVEVSFISFHDLLENGVPEDVDVILNAGRMGTAWSGGDHWKNAKIVSLLTQWVAQGGGFIGVGEPSAAAHSCQLFQLTDVLGVDRETGTTLNKCKQNVTVDSDGHFIMQDQTTDLDLGEDLSAVFTTDAQTRVLAAKADDSVRLAVHPFGQGRALYLSGFKFAPQNTRLLHRALFWTAAKEADYNTWSCTNVYTECAYYPNDQKLVVFNSSDDPQTTTVTDATGQTHNFTLEPHGIQFKTV